MNSQIEMSESAALASKLIERTRERKLKWEVANPSLGFAGKSDNSDEPVESDRFAAQLHDPNMQVVIGQIAKEFLVFSLLERDPRWSDQSVLTAIGGFDPPLAKDKIVLKVSVEKDPSYGYDTKQEQQLATLLIDLYEHARRSALKIDASVEKALSYLDRIAG
ncbi:hypothetical protein ACOBR2_20710 [Telmatobacter bradus]|uniref:hypothetical protein n=1 Tax=Telmatobacter bradus TaxID=474953 RepID=UPI003B4330D0